MFLAARSLGLENMTTLVELRMKMEDRARPVNHSLGDEELHSLGDAVRKLVQVLGCQSLSSLPTIWGGVSCSPKLILTLTSFTFGEVEEGGLPHPLLSQVGQQLPVHHVLHDQQVGL